jgi:hypothetical protein
MQPVAVGGLHNDPVRRCHRYGLAHEQIVRAPHVAREQQGPAFDVEGHGRRAQDVPGAVEGGRHARRDMGRRVKRQVCQAPQRQHGVFFGVERLGRLVARGVMPVGEGRALFLDAAAVRQQQLAQVDGGRRGQHHPFETLANQQRQRARVVQVRVREQHRVNAAGVEGQRLPVHLPQRLPALEQAAVDEQLVTAMFEQVLRAGHRAGCAQEGKFHVKASWNGP